MNRVVIIGNGFDLAHGLETSYSHFLKSLLVEYFGKSLKGEVKTPLFSIDRSSLTGIKIRDKNLKQLEMEDVPALVEEVVSKGIEKYVNFRGVFAKNILTFQSLNHWADLEYLFFNHIRMSAFEQNEFGGGGSIELINEQWGFLKNKFYEYLMKISKQFHRKSKFEDIFNEPFINLVDKSNDSIDLFGEKSLFNTYFLNFNYTTTYREYIKVGSCIDIHGLLNEGLDNLVFGWGDDMHSTYAKIEELNDNRYMKYTKSFDYLKTVRYHSLMAVLRSEYEVYIVGHSCGLSDRTMLQTIFNSEKCIQIKIFFHDRGDGTNDFIEKTIEISRHCPNKPGLRQKIVSFNDSRSM